jgi:hypothetical protein
MYAHRASIPTGNAITTAAGAKLDRTGQKQYVPGRFNFAPARSALRQQPIHCAFFIDVAKLGDKRISESNSQRYPVVSVIP